MLFVPSKELIELNEFKKLNETARTGADADQDVNVSVFAPANAPPCAKIVIQAFVNLPNLESEVRAISLAAVCAENSIRLDDVMESPKLTE
jgi:hypothetical protein